MQIHRDWTGLKAEAGGASVAMGNFDGVHKGHRAVIDAASKPGPGEYRIKGGAELVPGGKFSGAKPKSETERQIEMKAKQPGPGQYGAPKPLYFNKGGSGKFPFVFVPKDPKLKHLTKR